jgi:hypothetical protein
MKELVKKRVNKFIREAVILAEERKGNRHYVSDIRRSNLLMLEAVLPSLDKKSKERALRTIENLREQAKRASSFAL